MSSLTFDIVARDRASAAFSKLGKSMEKAHGDAGRMSAGFKTMAKGALVVAAAVGTVGGALVAFGKKSVDKFQEVGKETLKLQRYLGGTVEEASRFRAATKRAGIDTDVLTKSLGLFSKGLVAAKVQQQGYGAAQVAAAAAGKTFHKTLGANAAAFKDMGVAILDAKGKLLPLHDVLLRTADRFKTMPNGAEKTALALKLFGRAGAAMIPFLNRGAAGIKDLEKQSDKLGQTLSGKDIAAIKKNIAAKREYQAALEGLQIKLGRVLFPILVKVTEGMSKMAATISRWLDPAIRLVGRGVQAMVGGFRSGADHSKGFSGVLSQVGVAVRNVARWFVSDALPALRQFAGYVRTTMIPVVTKIANDALPGIRSAVASVTKAFQDNRPQIMQFLGALKSLANTIVTKVWPVLGPLLKLAFKGVGASISSALFWLARAVDYFNLVRSAVVTATNRIRFVWMAFWGGPFGAVIRAAWTVASAVVRAGVSAIIGAARTVRAVVGAIVGPFLSAVSGVRSAIGALVGMAAGIRGRIMGAVGNLGSLLYSAGRAVVEGLISGITSKLSGLASVASKLASTIARVMPGSPVREGPLRVLNNGRAGGAIVSMLAEGITARRGVVSRAMNDALGMPAATVRWPDTAGAVVPMLGRNPSARPLASGADSQPLVVNLVLDGRTIQQALLRVKRANGGLALELA